MNKMMTIEEIKNYYGERDVYPGKDNTFMTPSFGKYLPNITFIGPCKWNYDEKGELYSPLLYNADEELEKALGIQFKAYNVLFMFGEAFKSKKGGQMFKILPAERAKDILIRAAWGGAFEKSRGQGYSYAKSLEPMGLKYFRSASSHGGGCGIDYYIVPTNFWSVDSEVMSRVIEREHERLNKEDMVARHIFEKKRISREARDEYLPLIKETIEKFQEIQKKNRCARDEYRFEDDCIRKMGDLYPPRPYGPETLKYFQRILDRLEEAQRTHDIYEQKFNELIPLIKKANKNADCELGFTRASIWLGYTEFFDYSEDGLKEAKRFIERYVEKKREQEEKEEAESRELAAKIKKAEAYANAEALGYPPFKYYNRMGGRTNQSHAYVITPFGEIRPNDSLEYDNPNHRFKYDDPVHNADGVQHWERILPGELIVAFTKGCTADPLHFTIEWMPESVTSAQRKATDDILEEIKEQYHSVLNMAPEDVEGWDKLLDTTQPSLLK